MEDKILKQIEEEAKKRLPKLWDRISQDTFIEGAKFGYNIKESVDVEMSKNIEIVLPSSTSACKYDVQVKSMVGEILFEHTFYGNSKPLIKESVNEKLAQSLLKLKNNVIEVVNFSGTDLFDSVLLEIEKELLSASNQENNNIVQLDSDFTGALNDIEGEDKPTKQRFNQENNEGEKLRLIDFLCYLNDNKMINNYDFDYEQEASEYLSKINPPL